MTWCEMKKIRAVMNTPVYLGQTILDPSKIVMYEFRYDYIKPKHDKNPWLCYMDTDSLVYDIKTNDFYKDISGDVEARFDTSGYRHSQVCPLPIGVIKKDIGFMKDELEGRIMTEFLALRLKLYRIMTEFVTLKLKLYAYKMLDGSRDKKCKGVKNCFMNKTLDFENYKQCLSAGQNVFMETAVVSEEAT